MSNEQAFALYIAQNGDKFSTNDIPAMRNKAEHSGLPCAPLKSPTIAFILSFFLGTFGIDRFYLGQWFLGILKLITGGGLVIWWFIDLFIITSSTRRINYERFMR